MAAPHLVTAKELERMGRPDLELVRGRLVPVSPAGAAHGILAMFIGAKVHAFVEAHDLGRVYAAETGFVLQRNPDTVRGPDVGYVSRSRGTVVRLRRGFVLGPPDLAVEVRSPDDTLAELRRKAAEYLEGGTRLVWLVDPRPRKVYVYRPSQAPVTLSTHDVLDGGDVLPGFTLDLAHLFAQLD